MEATFKKNPRGIVFEGQEAGEEIILFLRPHVVTLVPFFIITVFLIFAPVIFGLAARFFGGELAFLSGGQKIILNIFWYLVVFAYAFYRFIFWYFNVYILSNERVVDFDFRGLLHKEVAYAKLNQIQDVSPKMIGFFSTFFHFGNVHIQTAAERPEFEFHHVARPDEVAHAILENVRKEEGEPPGVIA